MAARSTLWRPLIEDIKATQLCKSETCIFEKIPFYSIKQPVVLEFLWDVYFVTEILRFTDFCDACLWPETLSSKSNEWLGKYLSLLDFVWALHILETFPFGSETSELRLEMSLLWKLAELWALSEITDLIFFCRNLLSYDFFVRWLKLFKITNFAVGRWTCFVFGTQWEILQSFV